MADAKGGQPSARTDVESDESGWEDEDSDDSSLGLDDDDEWVEAVDGATGEIEAMRLLYEHDRTTFYLHGARVLEMFRFRRAHLDPPA